MNQTPLTPVALASAGQLTSSNCKRIGRGVPQILNVFKTSCSCRREKTFVFCRACGFYCHGRIRLKCREHPRVTFLLDITECPRCHSSVFLDEYSGSF